MIRSPHMSNENPDFEGWTLEDTVQRVGDPLRPALEQRLIVLGRLGKKAFELHVIGDPEVERLGAIAVSDCAKLADVYFAGEG